MISPVSRECLLVHGMSHGGWAWEPLARPRERAGRRVVAPDLPEHGRRAAERGRASIAAYARVAADAVMQAGLSRAIVVGHSLAGILTSI
jgi:pimeloyl-ACP methyl ester carboxylesterase